MNNLAVAYRNADRLEEALKEQAKKITAAHLQKRLQEAIGGKDHAHL